MCGTEELVSHFSLPILCLFSPLFPHFFTMIASLSLLVYVSTLNSTNLPIVYPYLCLVVEISRLVLRLAPFTNFFALSLLQNDFQLDRLAKVT